MQMDYSIRLNKVYNTKGEINSFPNYNLDS